MARRETQRPSGPIGQPTARYDNIGSSEAPGEDRTTFRPDTLAAAVHAVLAAGNAIMLSTTQDGGALRVMVFEGETKHKWYASGSEDIDDLLSALAQS